jgi:hypothetical protein
MGWFSNNDKTNIIVTNANGKSTAEIDVPVPIWEIILIAILVSVVVYTCCKCAYNRIEKEMKRQVSKHVMVSRINIEDV